MNSLATNDRAAAVVRVACWVVLGGVAAFAVLMTAAMALYPGGTWYQRGAAGHQFWQNFLCDLLRAQALNGQPNPLGSRLAFIGMLALLASMVPYWLLVPRLFGGERRLRVAVLGLGLLSVVCLLPVPFVSSDRHPALHAVVVIASALTGLVAAFFCVTGVIGGRRVSRLLGVLGVVMLLALAAGLTLHTRETWLGAQPGWHVPLVQKLGTLLALSWMIGTCWQVRRLARASNER